MCGGLPSPCQPGPPHGKAFLTIAARLLPLLFKHPTTQGLNMKPIIRLASRVILRLVSLALIYMGVAGLS
jgi:hypothetical protein